MNRSNKTVIAIVIGVLVVLCCLCIAGAILLGGGALTFLNIANSTEIENVEIDPWIEPDFLDPSTEETPSPTLAPISTGTPEPGAAETLLLLENSEVPNNDMLDLAERLGGKSDIPETLPAPAVPPQVGDRQTFFATNTDTNDNFSLDATLAYVTDHSYFWIEDGLDYDQGDLERLMETFENEIYPTNREFFGSEWAPGVDNDPHLYLLFATGLGYNLAGYYSSADEFSPEAHEYSNGHEMFMLNADNLSLDDEYTYGVIAHEFQHMIHWYGDRNESSWLNEGFSVLSEMLNGYDIGGFDYLFANDPDLQLNDWPNDPNATSPHYGAGFLYLAYFLDRFGEEMTKAVVADEDNGFVSIDKILTGANQVDPQTQEPIQADDVFQDWVVTNYLNDPSVEDGRYAYVQYSQAPRVSDTDQIDRCPENGEDYTVSQYGTDYINITCDGSYTLRFRGNTEVGVIPMDAQSGKFAFWSNKGDESDMTLTQRFDFSGVSGPVTLNYSTWYDLEEDYDYLYLEAREEGGAWQILTTPSGTNEDPSGNSYGWGYNGTTGGWIDEAIDLSEFAGKVVELRFEYVTDAAVNGEGFLLDDISIPEIGYASDFEEDDGGWEAAGFVRMRNILPQTFRVSLISQGNTTLVDSYTVEAGQTLEIPLEIGGDVDEATLVVSGTTPFTRQPAQYQISIE